MMLSSRTPLRVSFFGGGTDYPEYFERHRGAVVGMAIDKYVYISVLRLVNFVDYKYRVSYSRLDVGHDLDDIGHPVVKQVLRHYGIEDALDISVAADLPARSGLGSSSSFTVGFVNLIHALTGAAITKLELSRQATLVERELLGERVGVQDQLHATFGGINRFDFRQGRTQITPIQMNSACLKALTDSLVLVYTGISRFASETLSAQMEATKEGRVDRELGHLLALTDRCVEVLEGGDPERMIEEFGRMMHEGWMTKKRLSTRVSNPAIDKFYEGALASGALGGKLCGAGSGGFLLMVVRPEERARFAERLNSGKVIPVGLDTQGSTILRG